MVVSCSGADFNYYDAAGDWTMVVYAEDTAANSDTDDTETMTYNEGVLMRLNNDPITFGAVSVGSSDNICTNSPALNSENCGNVILNLSITGAAITGTGGSMAVGQFRIDDDATPSEGGETGKAELTLTTNPQDYSKVSGQAISTGSPATWSLYAFLNVPAVQMHGVYDTGTWAFTPSKMS